MDRRRRVLRGLLGAVAVLATALAAPPATYSGPGTARASFGHGARPSPHRYVQDEILVKFRSSASARSRESVHAKIGAKAVREYKAVRDLHRVKLPTGVTVGQALSAYSKHPDILYAEPNYVVQAFATPNDPRYPELWGLNNTGQTGGTPGADIRAQQAWDLAKGSTDVVVAVIDTGVNFRHPDLAANMFRNDADCNSNGIDDDGNGFVDDCFGVDVVGGVHGLNAEDFNGHGSHVSGTIGASGNNSVGVVGVNWTTRILGCRFLDALGQGTTADAIDCLDYVAIMKDRGVNIVASNNSWGGGGYSQALRDAIDSHRQRGMLFVAAAGNDGGSNDTLLTYPCSFDVPNIICVAATNASDALSSFSNFGKNTVHLGAPGEDILSTVIGDVDVSGYAVASGTSMATPHVTGAVALINSLFPGIDWRAAKNRILASGDTVPSLAQTVTGKRLNLLGALTCSNSTLLARTQPAGSVVNSYTGKPITLSALNINCAGPNGNVTVTVSPTGETVTLLDDGLGSDIGPGDGVYTATWTPATGGVYTLTFPNQDVVTVNLDPDVQIGFPVKATGGEGLPWSVALVADLDGDSRLDIVATSSFYFPENHLNAWNSSGTPLAGWPVSTPGTPFPAAGELSASHPGKEVFAINPTWTGSVVLTAYDGTGASLPGWPRSEPGNNVLLVPPMLADIDGDGVDEIFFADGNTGQLRALRADGTALPGWPMSNPNFGFGTPAIADLDGDGTLEIVTVGGNSLYAFHANGTLVQGFPAAFPVYNDTKAFPVIGDVDGDGKPDIVVVGKSTASSGSSVYIFGADGTLKHSIPLTGFVLTSIGTVPALADLDGDGVPEIIVQTVSALNVVRGSGETFPGWPVALGNDFTPFPVVGDVDGDGLPDIIIATRIPAANPDQALLGQVHVFDRHGVPHARFPKTLPIGVPAAPAIADIDGDGRNEIVIAGNFLNGEQGFFDKVWVFDLGGPPHGPVLWGQFMGNAKHTGTAVPQSAGPQAYYALDVTATGSGRVTSSPAGINCGSDCTESYLSGMPVTLTAAPVAGFRFIGWSGACTGTAAVCVLLIDGAKSVAADFGPIQRTLAVSRTGGGTGSVTSNLAGIACGNTCSAMFNSGATVQLTATSAADSTFSGWGGACAGQGNPCAVTLNSDSSVTATFQLLPPQSSAGGGGGRCFIATAAYGTPMAQEVRYLRAFRDQYLLTNRAGTWFVEWYYDWSPPVADYIRARDGLRAAVRWTLVPLVALSKGLIDPELAEGKATR